ncbi:MAG: hypothetical protein HKN43_15285 [Rhodothermales bacterium]|nr:hypothetical protein [Rhodothermales bacterium]
MRSIIIVIVFFLLSSCDSNSTDPPPPSLAGTGDSSIQWDGETRRYQLYVPPSYDPAVPAPIIVAFHGQGSDSKDMQSKTDLDAAAGGIGAIVAYLDDLTGDWAEGCDCAQADALGVDDVGFAGAVIDEITASYNIDSRRVYAVGFSIGGLFAQRIACDSSSRFEGVVSIASTMSVPLSTNCAPSDPVKVTVVLGSQDPVFPWNGTSVGIFSVLSVDAMTSEWITNNSCASTPVQRQTSLGSLPVATSIYATCEGGGAFVLHRVEGGEHFWYPGTGGLVAEFVAGSSQ